MIYENLTTEYLCYLMNRVQIEASGNTGYFKLCQCLLQTPFIPVLPMDENRSSECRELRMEFAYTTVYPNSQVMDDLAYPDSGNMLELLVVLAEKIKYNLKLSEYDESLKTFFLEMLHNAHIDFQNQYFDEGSVMRTLNRINIRQFQWDGEYSFFPLRCPHSDQRYEELIVQMNNYIEENYDIC